jgi:hypothetical protein
MTHIPNFNQYQPAADHLAPARRASILMYILAGMILLSSFCCVGVGAVLPKLLQEQPELAQSLKNIPKATPEILQITFIVLGGLAVIVAIVVGILGRFVSKGGMGSIIASIILSCLLALFLLVNIVQGVVMPNQPPAQRAGAMCMLVIPLALVGLLVAWLIQAARAAPHVSAMRRWQMNPAPQYYPQQYQAYSGPYVPPLPPPQYPPPGPNPGENRNIPPPPG